MFILFASVGIVERTEEADEGGVLITDEGESVLSIGGFGKRLRSQPCLSACEGVIRVEGSQSKQRCIKSKKRRSLQPFNAVCNDLDPGAPRGFPLLEWPPSSKVDPSVNVLVTQ